MQSKDFDSSIAEVLQLLSEVLDVCSVRFTLAMRAKLEKAELILQSLDLESSNSKNQKYLGSNSVNRQ